jgi:FixJ family two-component response regulator
LRKEPATSIVDDDQFVRDSLKRLMKSFGYIVAARLSQIPSSSGNFLFIADVNMPGVTGVELYECLIEAGQVIPTILVSAKPDDRVRSGALDKGVFAYLVKPFSETDLACYVRFASKSGNPQK